MKLTNKDKDYLISVGYLNEDFAVIENASIRYELIIKNPDVSIKISQKEVVKILGRNNFLTGIGRATFHSTALRHIESNTSIPNVFVYFKKIK